MFESETRSDARLAVPETTVTATVAVALSKGVDLWVHHNKLHFLDYGGVLTTEERGILQGKYSKVIPGLIREAHMNQVTSKEPYALGAPPTFQQEAALLYDEPDFFGIFSARLHGELDIEKLSKSMWAIVSRHEALRTRLEIHGGGIVQTTSACEAFNLDFVSADASCAEAEETALQQGIKEYVESWLASGNATFSARVIRLNRIRHVLVILWDHLFEDYTSQLLLFQELWTVYRALARGRSPELSTVPVQYREYATWQRETHTQWVAKHGGYWEKHLRGAVPVSLPASAVEEGSYGSVAALEIELGQKLSAAIQEFARRLRVSVALVILSLYVALLSRWSGQRDFLLPFYVSGRHHAKHLNTVGLFSHALPLRIQLAHAETIEGLLKAVATEFVSASKRLDIGQTLGETPHPLKNPFMQWFNSSPIPSDAMVPSSPIDDGKGGSITVEPCPVTWSSKDENALVESPIVLHFWKTVGGIVGKGRYRADLFTSAKMGSFVSDFKSLAAFMVTQDPGRKLPELSL